jgi:ferritin-like protein
VRADRRRFVLDIAVAAGVAPLALGVLEGTATALPRGDATDMEILSAALMLEHHAIALYDHGLERGLFPRGLRAYAVEFRGDHQGHRDTQVAILEERGALAPERASSYDFPGAAPGDAFIRQALEIEVAAQLAYTGLISQIRTDDYLLSAGFILIDEVRHMTVWRRVLGLKIY